MLTGVGGASFLVFCPDLPLTLERLHTVTFAEIYWANVWLQFRGTGITFWKNVTSWTSALKVFRFYNSKTKTYVQTHKKNIRNDFFPLIYQSDDCNRTVGVPVGQEQKALSQKDEPRSDWGGGASSCMRRNRLTWERIPWWTNPNQTKRRGLSLYMCRISRLKGHSFSCCVVLPNARCTFKLLLRVLSGNYGVKMDCFKKKRKKRRHCILAFASKIYERNTGLCFSLFFSLIVFFVCQTFLSE